MTYPTRNEHKKQEEEWRATAFQWSLRFHPVGAKLGSVHKTPQIHMIWLTLAALHPGVKATSLKV